MMIGLCAVLALAGTGFVGFVIGQKSSPESRPVPAADTQVPRVSDTASSSLDKSFALLREGDSKKALMELQGLQQGASPVYGIDFLVGRAALASGEPSLARESFQKALSKNEMEDEATLALALLDAGERTQGQGGATINDPDAQIRSAVDRYATLHPGEPLPHVLYAEFLRGQGSYRIASEELHRALLRCDPAVDPAIIAAREVLVSRQNNPAKEAPPVQSAPSMDGKAALDAALEAFGNHRPGEGVLFLERAAEFFPKGSFRLILLDPSFDEFRSDEKFRQFSNRF